MRVQPRSRPREGWLVIAVLAIVATTSRCSYALHPYRTLDGRAFHWDRVQGITPGTTVADVVAELGQPFEVLPAGQGASVWRYYERAQLYGCRTELLGFIPWSDTPTVSREARVRVVGGVVERVDVSPGKR